MTTPSLQSALDHVTNMKADLGGTNIIKPLLEIFKSDALPGISRQIFV